MMPGSGSSANKGGELKRAASTVSYYDVLYKICTDLMIILYWKYTSAPSNAMLCIVAV